MSTSHMVMHYIGLVCQSSDPQEVHVVNGILCSFCTTFFRNITLAYKKTRLYFFEVVVWL